MSRARQVVFVTGGASGIGLRVAELFAERGADVAIFDLAACEPAVDRISSASRGADRHVVAYPLDVTDAPRTSAVLAEATERIGVPDVVFHAAGIGGFSRPFEDFPAERFERMMRVNLLGTRNVSAAALPHMREGGRLALVSSLAGLVSAFGQSGYSASKHAVVGLAGVLRVEYAPRGIQVSVICPPEIDTPMARSDSATRPPETAAMKLFAGTLDLDEACRYMVEHVMRGEFLIIPGRRARLTWMLQRLLPSAVIHRISDRLVRKARRSGS